MDLQSSTLQLLAGRTVRIVDDPSPRVEFEDTSTLGRFHRMVQINTIDDANEPDTERDGSRERTKDVAKEANSLRRVQLGRDDFFFPAANGDGRPAGGAQIAYPVDLAPRGPDPTLASYLDDR
jgi:hypothetical protein